MEVAKTIKSVRELVKAARGAGKTIGFVPMMGALHAGHVSLIEEAIKRTNFVVVSIFVNPTQFGPGEDFEKYPRNLDADIEICERAGVAVVFAPSVEEMDREKNVEWVDVDGLTEGLCGRSRPSHFRGVTTVCAKLFNIVGADVAFFGQKDAQQAVVIKRMVMDSELPLEIVVCPTVREEDGLAVSSRNKYLSAEERQEAILLYKSLQRAEELLKEGGCDVEAVIDKMRKVLAGGENVEIEYISIVGAENLRDVEVLAGKVLVAIAAKVGQTRLIDNIIVEEKERSQKTG